MTKEELEAWVKDSSKAPIQVVNEEGTITLVAMHRTQAQYKTEVKVLVSSVSEDTVYLNCTIYNIQSLQYLLDREAMDISKVKHLLIDEYMLGLA